MNEQQQTDFEKELEQLINKYSIDDMTGMPDFVIAQFLSRCLYGLYSAVQGTKTLGRATLERIGKSVARELNKLE